MAIPGPTRRRPPRRKEIVSAAPIRPMKVNQGLPARRVRHDCAGRRRIEVEQDTEERRCDDQGRSGRKPMRQRFCRHRDSTGTPAMRIRSREPSSWSVASSRSSPSRLASRAPNHRIAGPMRASRPRSGPSANGTSVTTHEKKNQPDECAPADAHGKPHVAQDERRQRRHSVSPGQGRVGGALASPNRT